MSAAAAAAAGGGGPAPSVEDLEELCTCWVCFETFVEPITLHCGHTLCKDCIISVLKKTAQCPFCRHPFGVPLPPVNKAIVALVERLEALKSGVNVDVKPDELAAAMQFPQRQDACMLTSLPPEALRNILSHCDTKTLANVSLSCRLLRERVSDPLLWRDMCRARWPFVSIDRYKSWRTCFIAHTKIQRGWGTGKPGDFHVSTFRGHTGYITDFQLYRAILVTAASDHTARVWRASQSATKSATSFSTAEEAQMVLEGHEDAVTCVRFDEAAIMTGSADRSARTWDVMTGVQTGVYRTTAPVTAIRHTDSALFVGAENGLVKQWSSKTGECTHILAHAHAPVQGIWATDTELYVVAQDSTRIYDLRTGAARVEIGEPSRAYFVDAPRNELYLAGADGAVVVWDTAHGRRKRPLRTEGAAALTTLACDAARVVAGDEAGNVTVWERARGGARRTLSDHRERVNALQMDGRKLVTASADNTIKVWDLSTGQRQYTLLGGTLQRRANVPEHPTLRGIGMMHFDESRIVAGMKNIVRVYDFEVMPEGASE